MAYPTAVNSQITDAVTQARTSNAKCRLVVVAFVLGAIVASLIAKRRHEQSTDPGEQQ